MDKTENRISWYSAILIGLIMNSPKLLALRANGLAARYWHFNLAELLFQLTFNICFCYLLFYINLNSRKVPSIYSGAKKQIINYFLYALIMLGCCLAGGIAQRNIFLNTQIPGVYWAGYFSRFFLTALLAGIIIKIMLLLRESKQKDKENNKLKTAYLEAELEVLKEQLNPHFLFNSLSSLSGIITEDPEKAQHFISHLSKIFRYSLTKSHSHLVTIADELIMIKSYEELLKMRFEKAFQLETAIEKSYLNTKIPHLTLQPLLENAAKHNSATIARPLKVQIFISGHHLVISNNLQEIATPEDSTGIGLANLNSRFRILMNKEIEIEKTRDSFIVKLPIEL